MFSQEKLEEVLSHWNSSHIVKNSQDQGLINQTWLVGNPVSAVLQWVNPIFHHSIHNDIAEIVQYARNHNHFMPAIVPLHDGRSCLSEASGTWRMLEFVTGKTIHQIHNPNIAQEAGSLVGKFHQVFWNYKHQWNSPRRDIHNTAARMSDLEQALEKADGHHLEAKARALGKKILSDWKKWDGELNLPKHLCHGDLKISNLRFNNDDKAICLLDLDTLGEADFSVEMGDAWRSWCNPAGESDPDNIVFDENIFAASAKAWLAELPLISQLEKDNLVLGIQRICLELAARFCADAINNSYFKEDREKYPVIGKHNFIRAITQYNLAQEVRKKRHLCEKVITNS